MSGSYVTRVVGHKIHISPDDLSDDTAVSDTLNLAVRLALLINDFTIYTAIVEEVTEVYTPNPLETRKDEENNG